MRLLSRFVKKEVATTVASSGGGWFPWIVQEAFPGAWQRNIEWKRETVLAHNAVFACSTLIASDVSKLPLRMVRLDENDIWKPIPFGAQYRVLQRPNRYQNRIQFYESWILSKVTRGNTYALKVRRKGIVTELKVLSPDLVLPLVSDDGQVFYQLGADNINGIQEGAITVPASEIIHDRYNCLFHPLIGLPALFACGLAAYQGIKMQEYGAKFFKNMSRPSGILTAPGAISDETATRLKAQWEANYSGDNMGRVAVLGDDLKYVPLGVNAAESQMIEQMRLTAEIVCSTFHVPPYKIGVGDMPSYNNVEALNQEYYSTCLQKLIEDMEECLDRGLDMPDDIGVEFDLDNLLRMDSSALYEANSKGVGGGWLSPNEARKRLGLEPVRGGDTPYLQQQNYSLADLDQRNAPQEDAPAAIEDNTSDDIQRFLFALEKGLSS